MTIACDEPGAGLDLLRGALGTLHAQQYNLLIPRFTGALAEGLRKDRAIRGGAVRDQWSHCARDK
jgi:predicted NAD/FAD-binding protein